MISREMRGRIYELFRRGWLSDSIAHKLNLDKYVVREYSRRFNKQWPQVSKKKFIHAENDFEL